MAYLLFKDLKTEAGPCGLKSAGIIMLNNNKSYICKVQI